MDDDTHELIAQLCTRIGMIMEEASDGALTLGGQAAYLRLEQLQQLGRCSDKISCLVRAALVLADSETCGPGAWST